MKNYRTSLENIKSFFFPGGFLGLILLAGACATQTTQTKQSNIEKALSDPTISTIIAASAGQIMGAHFSPDARIFATGGFDKAVTLWEVSPRKQIHKLHGHTGPVFVLAFSPNGQMVASSEGKVIKLWDVAGKKELKSFQGHPGMINSIAFSPDGKSLVSSCADKTIKIWDVVSGEEKQTLPIKGEKPVAISPNGKILAFGGSEFSVTLWELESGKELRTLKGHSYSLYSIKFSPDGKTLATGGGDKKIKLWKVSDGTEIQTLDQTESVVDIAFSSDNKKIAGCGYNITKIWNAADRRELLSLPSNNGVIYRIAFSPDGKSLMSVSGKNDVLIWDTKTGQELYKS